MLFISSKKSSCFQDIHLSSFFPCLSQFADSQRSNVIVETTWNHFSLNQFLTPFAFLHNLVHKRIRCKAKRKVFLIILFEEFCFIGCFGLFTKIKKESRTSFLSTFFAFFPHKNVPSLIFKYWYMGEVSISGLLFFWWCLALLLNSCLANRWHHTP